MGDDTRKYWVPGKDRESNGLAVWACGSLEVLRGRAEEKFGVLFRRQEGNLDVCW